MKTFLILIFIIILLSSLTDDKRSMVPDEKTARKVAEAILLPIYGNQIYQDTPFVAKLKGDSVWVVSGGYKDKEKNDKPIFRVGGFEVIVIRKSDCKILRVIHTK